MHVNGGSTHHEAVTEGVPPGLTTSASTVTFSPWAGTQGVQITFEIVGFTPRVAEGSTVTARIKTKTTRNPLEPIENPVESPDKRLSGSPVESSTGRMQ